MKTIPKVLFLCTLAALVHANANAFDLISNAEFRQEMEAQASGVPERRFKALPAPGAPRIEVLAPNTQNGISAPFEIRLKFVAEKDAQIVNDSFKVLYGLFGIDITSRVMQVAQFQNNILRIENANIPAGKHRLTLKIKDSQQRETQQDLSVVVQ